jgi:cytochrome c oxidase accessory protein FixG
MNLPGSRADAPAAAASTDAAVELVSLFKAQEKIYARAVTGWFAGWRWALVWLTQLVFYGLPWLEWNARQAVLFDLGARRFYIFGLVLYPQDFIYLTGLLIVSAYALFLFTAVAGRLWCGYACPQTVYTEIYMWVERVIEGDRTRRMKRDAGGWTFDRVWRFGTKQFVWIAIGLWTGFTFVGYFTPIKELAVSALSFGFGPWEWFWVLFYGFATYGNAGYLREQVCKYMCPYARFQGVMFDNDTLTISYDTARGEPRGARGRKTDLKAAGLGSCIDCTLCVQVCPTGIDIRKGLQIECIGCAACVDVCDSVMDKMQYPRGLIRYATENGLAGQWSRAQMFKRVLRPRVLIYSVVLVAIVATLATSLVLRSPFRVDVERDRASLARLVDNGYIENVYTLQVMNTTERPQRYVVAADVLQGAQVDMREELAVAGAQVRRVAVSVRIPPEAAQALGPGAHPIDFRIDQQAAADGSDDATVVERSTFVVPR